MYDQEAKYEKGHDTTPEDPFVLPGSPFDHSNRVTTHAQGIRNIV